MPWESNPCIVIDNGSGWLRVGFSTEPSPRISVRNCVGRVKGQLKVLVADEIDQMVRDTSQLEIRRPTDRGFVTDWDVQVEIWREVLSRREFGLTDRATGRLNLSERSVIVTTPVLYPVSLASKLRTSVLDKMGAAAVMVLASPTCALQAVLSCRPPSAPNSAPFSASHAWSEHASDPESKSFVSSHSSEAAAAAAPQAPMTAREEATASEAGSYGSQSSLLASLSPPQLLQHDWPKSALPALHLGACLVVDLGFSACTITPFLPGQKGPFEAGIRRVNVGAKALANLLKERASLRELDISTDFVVAERILGSTCFVARSYDEDARMVRFLGREDSKGLGMGFARAAGVDFGERGNGGLGDLAEVALQAGQGSGQAQQVMQASMAGAGALRQYAADRCLGWLAAQAADLVCSGRALDQASSSTSSASGRPVLPPRLGAASAGLEQAASSSSASSSSPYSASTKEGETPSITAGLAAEALAKASAMVGAGAPRARARSGSGDSCCSDSSPISGSGSSVAAPALPADGSTEGMTSAQEARAVAAFQRASDILVSKCSDGKRGTAPDGVGALLWAVHRWNREHSFLGAGRAPGLASCLEPSVGPRVQLMMPDHVDVSASFVLGSEADPTRRYRKHPAPYLMPSRGDSQAPSAPMESGDGDGGASDEAETKDSAGSSSAAADPIGSLGKLQFMELGLDRFALPECLFNPADAGIQQRGLADAVADSIRACPMEMQPLLWSSIVLVGGLAQLPGLRDRLTTELESASPTEIRPEAAVLHQSELATWRGASSIGREALSKGAKHEFSTG